MLTSVIPDLQKSAELSQTPAVPGVPGAVERNRLHAVTASGCCGDSGQSTEADSQAANGETVIENWS